MVRSMINEQKGIKRPKIRKMKKLVLMVVTMRKAYIKESRKMKEVMLMKSLKISKTVREIMSMMVMMTKIDVRGKRRGRRGFLTLIMKTILIF